MIRVGVAIGLLFLVFQFVPIADVARALAHANGWWIGAGFALVFVERIVAASRIWTLTNRLGIPISVSKHWEISAAATFYTTFLPGDLAGGVVRWHKIAKPGAQRAQAFASLVYERLIDTIILLLFGIVFWIWDDPPFGGLLLDLVSVSMLLVLIGISAMGLSPRAPAVFAWLVRWIPGQRIPAILEEKGGKVLASISAFRELPGADIVKILVLSVLRHALSIAFLICFANSIQVDIGFATLAWIRSLSNIITMLPIAFAGLGVREGSFAILLEPYGVAAANAVSLSLLSFSTHMLMALIGGLLELKNTFSPDPERSTTPGSS